MRPPSSSLHAGGLDQRSGRSPAARPTTGQACAPAPWRFRAEKSRKKCKKRDLMHQGFGNSVADNFMDFVWAYALLGLHAEHYQADLNTDAVQLQRDAILQATAYFTA
jgi:hypothetical protein